MEHEVHIRMASWESTKHHTTTTFAEFGEQTKDYEYILSYSTPNRSKHELIILPYNVSLSHYSHFTAVWRNIPIILCTMNNHLHATVSRIFDPHNVLECSICCK